MALRGSTCRTLARLKQRSAVPVLVTGGFQTASVIREAIERGDCDGVTMARPLVANPDLPNRFAAGHDRAERPCTYCNKCLFAFVENPLGCYDERRFDSREEMVRQILSVYEPVHAADSRAPKASDGDRMTGSVVFEPLAFRHLTIKNRVLRSSLAGRFNNYDGTGTRIHINWDLKFAKGGVGAIISSNAPVHPRGLIVPNYAHIDRDETIPFWRELVDEVHEHDCKYLVQLAFSGTAAGRRRDRVREGLELDRQARADPRARVRRDDEARDRRDRRGVRAGRAPRARGRRRRDRDPRLQRLPDHAVPLVRDQRPRRRLRRRRSRTARASRSRSSARSARRSATTSTCSSRSAPSSTTTICSPGTSQGNTIDDSIQVCRWLEEAGVDGFHVSSGATFPHPRNPAGEFPIADTIRGYDAMISSGRHTWRNYLMFRTWGVNTLFKHRWEKAAKSATSGRIEGINLPDARRIKEAVSVPVVCTGGFQTRSAVESAIERGDCDGVTIGRPLIANNDLVKLWAEGHDRPPNPCTYSNKCLINQLENPLGCYEPSRYASHEEMVEDIMSVFDPPPFVETEINRLVGDVLFEPLRFRNLEVRNRILRSNIAGRFDGYDGSGTSTRINWE